MVSTKYQEREALNQIKAIVESLGDDSYIATAFTGVWEIAESNIQNDFADSCQNYIDQYNKARDDLKNIQRESQLEVTELKEQVKKLETAYLDINVEARKKESVMTKEIECLRGENNKARCNLEEAQREVVRLKAKLYDLLISD